MVVQSKESKAPSSLVELLVGSSKSKSKSSNANNTFAQLLSTLSEPKTGKSIAKTADFTAVIDPKNSAIPSKTVDPKTLDTKKLSSKGLSELLSGKEDESKLFPKELINALSNDQVHSLIQKAKEYLKNAITEKSPELQADIKALPKTLIGLIELAHKIGIDMSEITLSTLDKESVNPFKELPVSLLTKPLLELKEPLKETTPERSKGFEAIVQLLSDTKTVEINPVETKPLETKAVETKSLEVEMKGSKDSVKPSAHPLQALLKGLDKSPEMVMDIHKEALKETPKELSKSFLSAPHMEGLSALLRGNNESDARQSKEEIKPLTESTKMHPVHKADSLEVRGKEAVQSMRHFAIDLKEAAESYKPPFTRLTMKLNPERLGEVDVTLIQRGSNVHVTIQSANANSIAFLAHNATELKAQLASQGVTNTTMNFMTGSENQQQNPGQQQQQQNQNRFRSYQSLAELQHSTEELTALEIIIPHYA
ncbi:MAG: flagellar hook-length control protein FliK [Sulfuricurvum sp.]|nr:flagellar hook-length control protein FliK [Sulfuricurvum sp.]